MEKAEINKTETANLPAASEDTHGFSGASDDKAAALSPQDEQTAHDGGKEKMNTDPKTTSVYYEINEEAARRAKQANSFYSYKQGSATAEYRQYVDEAVKIAEQQKSRVDPMYHSKIDGLLNSYCRKLAENMNNRYSIDSRVPSVMITGGSNFPVRKKEKQNAAREKNWGEWQDIQGLLDKIRSIGMGGISADDPNAIQKLQSKLAGLEKSQETMKAVNAYYRTHKTLDGCPNLTADQIETLKADMSRNWRAAPKPFEAWALSNNNAEIRRVNGRIEELTRHNTAVFVGWQFDGGKVVPNQEINRLQVFFDSKPEADIRKELKSNGFQWSPNAGAWQRQLTANAIYASNHIKCIQPITGEKPSDLQRAARAEGVQSAGQHEQHAQEKSVLGQIAEAREARRITQPDRENKPSVKKNHGPEL